jgi:dolichol-phosphate mannosyltransferase
MTAPEHSIVIPAFNERTALPRLLDEVEQTMEELGSQYECIVVDDGSTDGTSEWLDARAAQPTSRLRPIHLLRNRGQGAALWVGLVRARGAVVITLDGDGQNCPSDIPDLLAALAVDARDLVCGVRADRQDGLGRRWMSRLANGVRARVLRDGLRDSGCGLKVMRRDVIPFLLPLRTLYSFIPALAVAAGFTVGERTVRHRPRDGGRSSYGLRVFLWRPLVDMLGIRWYQARCALHGDDVSYVAPAR